MKASEVIAKIDKKNMKAFYKFMEGQTVGLNPKGEIDYYECDVDNFMNKLKGKPTFFD